MTMEPEAEPEPLEGETGTDQDPEAEPGEKVVSLDSFRKKP